MKTFHHSNLLWTTLRLGLGKIGTVIESGLLKFVRKGFICKRQTHLEPNNLDCICSELTIYNKKWICFSIYRPTNFQNKVHMSCPTRWEKLINHKKTLLQWEILIQILVLNSDHDKLEQFCSLFNLQSLIKKETCITKTHKSTTDLILTNKLLSFQGSSVIETD